MRESFHFCCCCRFIQRKAFRVLVMPLKRELESFHFCFLVLLKKKKKKNTGSVKRQNKEGKKGIYQDVKKSGHSWCSHAM